MKWCSGCEDYHDESAFNKRVLSLDGLQSRCRDWQKKYHDNRTSEQRERHDTYMQEYNGKPSSKQQAHERYAERYADPETRQQYLDNSKAWREANPERVRELASQHGGWTDYRREFHERRVGRILAGEEIDRRAVWGRDEGHCRIKPVCDGTFVPFKEMHMDHIIPLSRGGAHTWNNVQTGCGPCNLAKGSKILEVAP